MTQAKVEFLAQVFKIRQTPQDLTRWCDAREQLWDGCGHDPNGEQW